MHKGIFSVAENGKILLTLAKEFYLREAVFAAAHKFSGVCDIEIFPVGEFEVGVRLALRSDVPECDLNTIAYNFSEELVDQQIRLDLDKRNGRIRKIIVQHAFSPIDDLVAKVGK
jgi:His-Xaa-Ser system protein HxsD